MPARDAPDSPFRRSWQVRLKVLLACGLTLGTGATTTLAAWTDGTEAKGEFEASTFVVEANPSAPYAASGPWSPHTEEAAVLQLEATDLTPGSTRYAPLALRTTTGSLGGTAVLGGAEVTGTPLGPALRYRVTTYDPPAGECGGDDFAGGAEAVVGDGTAPVPLTTGQDAHHPLELPAASDTDPGGPVHLCVELSLPSDADSALQGESATARWQIISTSETT
ncbi:hypothetical protein [Brachybacterium sacelli]|uniref:Ribosomally synthesized peptide with SipW-like signal peptide n=1 Tax=Brachybacterium sacelli TaxID=173364 RepID=A0ABS4X3T3_9MICO|nr:hypothetical protein [Brachybacterium sacelli]MBP2383110.1 putative ribosomally synthesized peptide with SipW-like signal peptide [Brachybacterium sacelli]